MMQRTQQLTKEIYDQAYQQSITQPGAFWAEQALQFIDWHKPWDKIARCDLFSGKISWFEGAKLNVCYNCIDRHLPEHKDKVAYYFEGNDPAHTEALTYAQLHEQVCLMSNTLKSIGVKKGDRVCIYMPMIPQTIIAMLACARIGAIHNVVFAGFSSASLRQRILDAGCTIVITADEGLRGDKQIPLKATVYEALKEPNNVSSVLCIRYTGAQVPHDPFRDIDYQTVVSRQSSTCEPEWMDAEDPLFILYTSGSTGQPKGVLHTQAGYLLMAAMTFQYVFDHQENDVFWCTADLGWITGHTYGLYGALANAATSVIFEGVPTYPTAARYWETIDKYHVSIFYTAPTVIRSLMAQSDTHLLSSTRDSLRVLGSVGEPINPEAWRWYHEKVGQGRCPIVDTWWQTETGAIMIAPLPNIAPQKPGSACLPFFGVQPQIVNEQGRPVPYGEEGALIIKQSWPSQMRTVYQQHDRFVETYLSQYPGAYTTGDGAIQDQDGHYKMMGRLDDVMNVSGHRIGTAEIESILVEDKNVAEAAVVAVYDKIKGEVPVAFVMLCEDAKPSNTLRKDLMRRIEVQMGKFASIKTLFFCTELPKTRSGKILRRLLKQIAAKDFDNLGDTSTLANPESIKRLIDASTNTEIGVI